MSGPTKFLSSKNEMNMEQALTAVAVYPTLEQAAKFMKDSCGVTVTPKVLEVNARKHADQLEEIRQRIAPQLEGKLANDMLDNSALATEVSRMAIERCAELLAEKRVQDPSKMARDLSQVATQGVDKRLALQGRPTQIIEKRNTDEIVRQLEALGVAKQIDVIAEVTDDDGREPEDAA